MNDITRQIVKILSPRTQKEREQLRRAWVELEQAFSSAPEYLSIREKIEWAKRYLEAGNN